MARQSIVAQRFPLSGGLASYYPSVPLVALSAQLTWSTLVVVDGAVTPVVDGKTMVFARNTDAATARTITITSVEDSLSRLGTITAYSVPINGDIGFFGPFKTVGWSNSTPSGLWIDVSHVALLIAVVTLP